MQYFSIVVAGSQSLKKTSFATKCLSLSHQEILENTITSNQITVDDSAYHVSISTTSGIEDLFGINELLLKQAHGIICLYNPADRSTLDSICGIREEALHAQGVGDIPFAIVAINSSEVPVVSTEEVQQLAVRWGACSVFTSALDEISLQQKATLLPKDCLSKFIKEVEKFHRVESNAKETDDQIPQFQMMVLGDTFVGKTTLIKLVTNKIFTKKYIETTETEVYPKTRITLDAESCNLTLIDTCGRMKDFSKDQVGNVGGLILVYSVSSVISFKRLESLHKAFLQSKGVHAVACCIVGTKTDIDNRTVQKTDVDNFAKSIGAKHFETSLLNKPKYVSKILSHLAADIKSWVQKDSPLVILNLDKTSSLFKTNRSGKKAKPIVAVLKGGMFYATSDGVIGPKTKSIDLLSGSVTVDTLPAEPSKSLFPFELYDPSRRFNLYASTEADLKDWIQCIITNISYGGIGYALLEDVVQMLLVSEFEEITGTTATLKTASNPNLAYLSTARNENRMSWRSKTLDVSTLQSAQAQANLNTSQSVPPPSPSSSKRSLFRRTKSSSEKRKSSLSLLGGKSKKDKDKEK